MESLVSRLWTLTRRLVHAVTPAVTLVVTLLVAAPSPARAGDCPPGFSPPPGTVAVDLIVDDRANRVYRPGDLKWKGSFLYDEATRRLTLDPSWSGVAPGGAPLSGWPTLYDDGPWSEGGHEPLGAKAGDHRWGITVFVAPPAFGTDVYAYGLIDASYETRLGNGWVWKGPNGSFQVPAGAAGALVAAGQTFPRFGKTDLVLVLEASALNPGFVWDLSTVQVKSSAWGWGLLPMTALGGGTYVFDLGSALGRTGPLPHSGLLSPGDVPEFVFTLGGQEYAAWSTPDGLNWLWMALRDGVGAATRARCQPLPVPAPLLTLLGNGNTAILVPTASCPADE